MFVNNGEVAIECVGSRLDHTMEFPMLEISIVREVTWSFIGVDEDNAFNVRYRTSPPKTFYVRSECR
eukprot:8918882-Prorocentrum_lima.AAC.1